MNIVEKCVTTALDNIVLSESEVVFMSFILFLIIALMLSITINVTLLAIIYIQYINSIINKE